MWRRLIEKPAFHVVLIALLGLIAYSNTFHVPFQWDEEGFIFPVARDLNYFIEPAKAKWFEFYDFFISRYAAYMTFALNYKIHGLSVRGYHILNIAVHLLNAVLVYFFIRLTFKTPVLKDAGSASTAGFMALISALLFVSHPVQTEAVTYIYQRFTSLAAMLYLCAIVLYIKWRLREGTRGRAFFYILSLLSALLAVKTKENAFTLPLVIGLYEVSFFTGGFKKRLPALVPFFFVALIIPITLIYANRPAPESVGLVSRSNSMLTRQDYLLTQFTVIVTYIRLLFFPVNQNFDYDYPTFHSLFNPSVFLSFLLLLLIVVLGIFLRKGLRATSFGILWFFITLSVESSIIPIADLCVEHREYLPSAGFFMAVSSGIFYMLKKADSKAMTAASAFFLTAAVLLLAFLTYERNNLWKSKISLWEDTAEKSPLKSRPHSNLGLACMEAGLNDRAIEQFNIALKLDPANPSAHNNLGSLYQKMGRLDEAIEHYKEAVSLQPDLAAAHYNLGIIYSAAGSAEKAVEHYLSALWFRPDMASAHYNLGVLLGERGLNDKAIDHYERALRISPDFKTHVNLGIAYKSSGRLDEAIAQQRTALTLNPLCAEAYYNMGNAYKAKGQNDKAVESFLSAVRLRPNYEGAHLNLGLTYFEDRLYGKAVRSLETALSLNPRNSYARRALLEAKSAKSGSSKKDGQGR